MVTGFHMVHTALVAEVGAPAAILATRIAWRCEVADEGRWPASRADLTRETGLSPDVIRTASRVLVNRGLVATARLSSDDPTTVWSWLGEMSIYAGQDPGEISTTPLGKSPLTSYETEAKTTTPPSPPTADEPLPMVEAVPSRALAAVPDLAAEPDPLDAEFAEFWSRYPRKVGKKPARAAWTRARRTTALEVIAAGLMAQLPGMRTEMERGRERFVLHPATWLNQARWDDDAQHAARGAALGQPAGKNWLLDLGGQGQAAIDAMLAAPPFPSRALGGPQ